MKNYKIKLFLFSLLGMLVFSQAQAQESKPQPKNQTQPQPKETVIDRVVASVNGMPILESQVQNTLRLMRKKNTEENRKLALDYIINDIVIQAAIHGSNIKVTPQQIELAMEREAARNGLTYGQLLDQLDYSHISVADFQRRLAEQIIIGQLQSKVINQSIRLNPQDIESLGEDLYRKAKQSGDMKKIVQDQYDVRHILLKVNPLLSDQQAKAKLNEIRKNILDGKITFAKAALDYSKDYLTGANGGDLGFAFPNNYVPPFAKKIVSTPKGKISHPFKTQFGWHILEVMGTRPENVTKQYYIKVAEQELINKQRQELAKNWVSVLRQNVNIRYFK